MGSSTMWPFTLGAMPTKFARTVAASVSGRISHRQTVTTIAIAAPMRMSTPIARPRPRRGPDGGSSRSAAMGSAPKEVQQDQRDEDYQPPVHEHARPEMRIEPGPREELPAQDGPDHADDEGAHP